MPGSGKSTIGKPLAEYLKVPFVDLDHIIEEQEGALVREIFSQKGETYFRAAEQRYLQKTASTYADFVLSTGGGTPCYFDNIDFMKSRGKVVFLDIEVAILSERLQKEGLQKRPLLKEYTSTPALEQHLQNTLSQRKPFYTKADLQIKILKQSPAKLAEKIIHDLKIKA